MNPNPSFLSANIKTWIDQNRVKPKSKDLSRSLGIKVIFTLDSKFPTIKKHTCILL